MNKTRYVVFGMPVIAILYMLIACEMGYQGKDVVDAAPPAITAQPQSVGVEVNNAVTLTVAASLPNEGGTLRYQWYQFLTFRAYEEQAGILIPDATEASFAPPVSEDGEFNYYVVVTNDDPSRSGRKMSSVKSSPVTVTVNNPDNALYPVITEQPIGGSGLTWSPRIALPTLTVAASVTPSNKSDEIRYQWYVSETLSNTQGVPIKDATAPSLVPPIAIAGQEATEGLISGAGSYYYFVVVTNYYFNVSGRRESSVASSPVLISIAVNPNADAPVISKQPANAIYFNGDTVAPLTVTADQPEDGGTLSYQWFSNTKLDNSGGSPVAGATSAAYTPALSTATPSRNFYYAVVTNTNPYVTNPTTNTASKAAEVVITTPATKTANATFTVQFGGANQYQFVRGFGGMDVAWGNFPDYRWSGGSPSGEDYEKLYNPDQLGLNMLRIMILPANVDINKTLDDLVHNRIYTTMDRSQFFENVKTVNRYGGYVLASPWSPPALWKTNNSINGGGTLRKSDYQNYAYYLRSFAQIMLNNGAPVYAISIQNEPNYTAGYDGCEWTSDDARDFFRQVGRFTQGGSSGTNNVDYPGDIPGYGGGKIIPVVKTMNGESANTVAFNASAMGTAAAKRNIDVLGRHNYGSRDTNAAGGNGDKGLGSPSSNWIYHATDPREMWMTEHNLNSNSGASYPNDHTWNYIWLFMNDVDMTVRINHEAAFIWWSSKRFYSMLGDGTYGSRDMEILPRGWGLAHYSKFAKESYRVGVDITGTTKGGEELVEGTHFNGFRYEDFTSTTVKVSAYMKLRGGELYPVNWRNQTVPIADIAEITMVMFTPTNVSGQNGIDMGTVKLQLPAGFKISGATAMRSDKDIFDAGKTDRGEPKWETVEITADRNAAFVNLPASTILSVRFTQ